jgi:hypothetical protein
LSNLERGRSEFDRDARAFTATTCESVMRLD